MLPLVCFLSAILGAAPNPGSSLAEARRLADDQRFEEAVVEYQRYLTSDGRPLLERAQALAELGFMHLVLGDEGNAEARVLEALELDPTVRLLPSAPPKQVELLKRVRQEFASRPRLEVLARQSDDAPNSVRVRVADPGRAVKRVMLRHSLARSGPFASAALRCDEDGACLGAVPPPSDGASFTSFYFVEALDASQASVAKGGSFDAPLQLSVVSQKAWYKSPWVWGISGAAAVGIAAVIFLVSPAPPKP